MASHVTVEDWTDVEGEYVVDVTIRAVDDENYPSGWDYSLHVGTLGGETVLRYDNAHVRTKGHERHTHDEVEQIEFPGMLELYARFKREVEKLTPVSWDWPHSESDAT